MEMGTMEYALLKDQIVWTKRPVGTVALLIGIGA